MWRYLDKVALSNCGDPQKGPIKSKCGIWSEKSKESLPQQYNFNKNGSRINLNPDDVIQKYVKIKF